MKKEHSSQVTKVSGIYIWGFRIDGTFIPYYVGKSSDIEFRIKEHIAALVSGKYTIYHKDSLKEFARYKKSNQGAHKVFDSNYPYNILEFITRRKELFVHIDFLLDRFEFTYSEIQDTSIKLGEYEKYIIGIIGKEALGNTRGGDSVFSSSRILGNKEIIKILDKLQ